MPFKLGPLELVLILVIIFIIFGAGKLPQMFESIGKGIANFRKGRAGEDEVAEATTKKKTKKSTTRKQA
jgi:sec-independent protein translocase protein TatA